MLHETICNDDFSRNAKLMPYNVPDGTIFSTISTSAACTLRVLDLKSKTCKCNAKYGLFRSVARKIVVANRLVWHQLD